MGEKYDPVEEKCRYFAELLAENPDFVHRWGVLLNDAAKELGDKMPGPHDPMLRYWRAAFVEGYHLGFEAGE